MQCEVFGKMNLYLGTIKEFIECDLEVHKTGRIGSYINQLFSEPTL